MHPDLRYTRVVEPKPVTQASLLRILYAGFGLVIVLLLAVGFAGVSNIRAIRLSAASMTREQGLTGRLMEEVEREQAALGAVLDSLSRDEPETLDEDAIAAQLEATSQSIGRIVAERAGAAEEPLLRRLDEATRTFAAEARRLLEEEDEPALASRDLFARHGEVVAAVSRLIGSSYETAVAGQRQINARSEVLLRESFLLLGACLALAVAFAAFTVRTSARMFEEMGRQESELSRVSWHLLENQETAARRFSHEMHDELGQSLMAVKANLDSAEPARLPECAALVDEAIRNVRELSQLLRPTILDDFGLEASLRWLCEGFSSRTGIETSFTAGAPGRFSDGAETHLFRIAQEALTNVARHSGASRVEMGLRPAGPGILELSISDNGCGVGPRDPEKPAGLGLTGMRARARQLGGHLIVEPSNGGTRIRARVPFASIGNDEENSHPAS